MRKLTTLLDLGTSWIIGSCKARKREMTTVLGQGMNWISNHKRKNDSSVGTRNLLDWES